jgi:hypothetical protein
MDLDPKLGKIASCYRVTREIRPGALVMCSLAYELPACTLADAPEVFR